LIPINRQSGTSVGVIGQSHWVLDDIFPTSIGRPIVGNGIATGRPILGR